MDVRLAGAGPAADAVEAALSDVGTAARPIRVDAENLGGSDLAVACGAVGTGTAAAAAESVRETDTPLLTVERGGIGGYPVEGVRAAVAGFAPGAGCFSCLATRVAAGDPTTSAPTDDPDAMSAGRLGGAIAGHEAVTLLQGRGSPLLPTIADGTQLSAVIEVPHTRRTLLPVPGCECDPGTEPDFEWSFRTVPLADALERAERALDDRIGLIRQVGEAESFPAPYYLAEISDTTEFSDASAPRQAAGVDLDWNRAFMKALGEGLERYSAGVYRTKALTEAPIDDLADAVSPDAFVRPDDAPEVDPTTPIRWVRATSLTDGETVHLPAEVVRFPPPEERYIPSITTGLGLGSSAVEAGLSGLYEVIERDATMIAWYSTFEPLELRVEDEDFKTLARRARSEDLSVTPLLVTVDIDVPVVAVAVHRETAWPKFALGSAARLDPAAAARSGLAEAIQNWLELRSMGRDTARNEPTAIGRYADFPGAMRAFLDAQGPVPASEVGHHDIPTGTDELDTVVEAVEEEGLTPYVAPLTPRDVDRIGFVAVRVSVPGAQPLFTDTPAFGDRVRSVPTALGFDPALDRSFHPYP